MDDTTDPVDPDIAPSRRRFLATGAGSVAGMAALLTPSLGGVAQASEMTLAQATDSLVGTGIAPPTAEPGALVRTIGAPDAGAYGAALLAASAGAYAPELHTNLGLEAGDRLARLDVYAYRTATTRAIQLRRCQTNTATDSVIISMTAGAPDGLKVLTYDPPPTTVGLGEYFYLLDTTSGVSAAFVGAIVQYFPAKPQLNLLSAPVRIYDSRPGPPTTTTPKGKFTNETRVVDSGNNGSGVPNTAKAVIVNFAVTNTNSGGYGTLWAAGIADPGTASLNWSPTASSTLNNSVLTAVDTNGQFNVKIAGSADVILDVVAYYA